MNLHWIDYAIILGYLLVSLIVGLSMSRRAAKDGESYFLGGRSISWWLSGISLAATSFASDTPLAVTEIVRGRGLQRLWWLYVSVITLIVGIFLFSRLWRRLEIMTDAEFYEVRYDGQPAAFMRLFRAFMSGVVSNLITIAWVTLGMASIIHVVMPQFDKWTAVGVAMGITLVYTVFGGLFSAVLTDLVQFVIAIAAMVALAVISVNTFGGMDKVLEAVRNNPAYGERTLSMFPDFGKGGLDLACFAILLGLWWTDIGGYVMQRISACRNEGDAVKSMLFFAFWQAIRPWMWVVVGLVSIAVFPVLDGKYTDTDAYPLVMNKYLGVGLKGLLVTAFIAAFMSTITTQLNWGASYLMGDMYTRFIRKNPSRKEYILVSRLLTALLAVGGIAMVPMFASVTAAWEFLALLGAGSGIIAFFRWFWWRINAWTEVAALIVGTACGLLNALLNWRAPTWVVFGYPWGEMRFEIKLLVFTIIVIVSCLVVTFLTPPVKREKLEAFYRKARPGGFWGAVSPEARALPGKALSPLFLLDVFFGFCLCLGGTLGIGYSILLEPLYATIGYVVCLIGAVGVYFWYRREEGALNAASAGAQPEPQQAGEKA